MSHAPAPWSLCYDGQIDANDGTLVCRFHWDSYSGFKTGSNADTARLIAASPDLLAALEHLLSVLDYNDDISIDLSKAHDAVDKARGAK